MVVRIICRPRGLPEWLLRTALGIRFPPWACLALVVALTATVFSSDVKQPRPPLNAAPDPHDAYSLGLWIEESQTDLLLHWNPQSLPIRDAVSGQLSIQNGDAETTILLTPDQLGRGIASYPSHATELRFRLLVMARHLSVAEEGLHRCLPVAGVPASLDLRRRPAKSCPPSEAQWSSWVTF